MPHAPPQQRSGRGFEGFAAPRLLRIVTIEASVSEVLDYAPSPDGRRRRWRLPRAVLTAFDIATSAMLLSQASFLLAMTITNVHECGVAPYGVGSSYHSPALGNAEFVRTFPGAAAIIAGLPRFPLETLGIPAMIGAMLTLTALPWLMAAYLIWRCFGTGGRRRAATVCLALVALAMAPYVKPAIVVFLD